MTMHTANNAYGDDYGACGNDVYDGYDNDDDGDDDDDDSVTILTMLTHV